jgi:tRNA-uridine 2-sulfurtransferase
MSGGLDSILAAKVLGGQGIEVVLVCFESYFFSCQAAKKAAQEIGLDLRVEDISKPQLDIVKHPRYGHGGAVNPCIDCHLLMLKTAKKIMDDDGFDFVATGEVLGERPMSQNQRSLDIIEKESGLAGKLLRPLSAKLLPETEVEKRGIVDRSLLCGISGRSRKEQLALADRFGLKNIPQPGGGCILTEKEFGSRLKELIQKKVDFDGFDAGVLRYGRPIWEGNLLIVVARDAKDCDMLQKLTKLGDIILLPENFPGPVVLARNFGGATSKEQAELSGRKYLFQYSKKIPEVPKISAEYIG